ncbi:YybS family protein, partial [Anaerovibrio sp.]|uniref:YybS family protein n=1 Tax=Anaerovibrio sp. TaxID=1872532 RepID=UPI003F185821
LWPLPIIVLIVRHGMQYGVLSVTAAAIIMTILISPMSAVHMVAAFGPPSLALGYGFYKGLSASRVLLYGIVASLIGVFLTAGLTMLITGINPLAMAEQVESMKEAAGAAFQMYDALGMSADELARTKKQFMDAMEYVTLLLPVVFLLSGMITAWLNFAVGGKVLRRLGHHVTTLPDFDEWRLPKAILYIFGFSLVGLYWGSTRDIELLQQVSLNAYVLSTLAGFVQGASVISSFARNRISRWLFWIIMLFIFLNGAISQLLAVGGLFDMLFDYRRRFRRG